MSDRLSNAAMMLNDEQVAIKIDQDGFLKRIRHTVRLTYGPDLYSASRPGSERDDTKVSIYAPGYMRYVQAIGGVLNCPPALRNPVTGVWEENPKITRYDDGLIRRIEATGMCSVRNPQTGEYVTSFQTIVFDAEQVLRQKLLNVSTERQDIVQILSREDIEEMKADPEKPLKGWSIFPLAPPFTYIAANNRAPIVREAIVDWHNLVTTARQRACSKAERLAADHNPVVRKTWLYGALKVGQGGVRYVDIPVVTWVEYREKGAMQAWLERLASASAEDEGLGQVIYGDPIEDTGEDEVDNDEEVEAARRARAAAAPETESAAPPAPPPEEPAAPKVPLLEQREDIPNPALPPAEPAQEKELVYVAPAKEAAPAATATPSISPAKQTLIERIERLERNVPPDEIPRMREVCGIGKTLADYEEAVLRTYQKEVARMAATFGGGGS